jgi:hypothetical protein
MIYTNSFSEVGDHAKNEDAFFVEQHPNGGYLCALADGQGGRPGGFEAARLACDVVIAKTKHLPASKLKETSTWSSALEQADQAVFADKAAGCTTLLGFYLTEDRITGASSGDSAILLKSSALDAQELTQNQHKNPPIGSGGARIVSFVEKLKAPWSVLAMSDGVWKYVGWRSLIEAVASLRGQALLDKLQEQARLKSGRFPDDFTVTLFECF